jgi:hypothetical protein
MLPRENSNDLSLSLGFDLREVRSSVMAQQVPHPHQLGTRVASNLHFAVIAPSLGIVRTMAGLGDTSLTAGSSTSVTNN